tara:strand:- start:515 stop:658 length:144 start_codon:yes stop_codon:yes gene_type:complete
VVSKEYAHSSGVLPIGLVLEKKWQPSELFLADDLSPDKVGKYDARFI